MRIMLCALLTLTAASARAADVPTCQNVIDAKDEPTMQAQVAIWRDLTLKGAAIYNAKQLHDELEQRGVNNAYQLSLEMYETKFAPARDHLGGWWLNLEKEQGGMSAAFAALCNQRDLDVASFYR